jgi:altronate dehydratase large subunit
MSELGFYGYKRENSYPGIRNYVGIFSTVVCANQLTRNIAAKVPNCVSFTHSHGCGQVKSDLELVENILVNLISNPNIGAAIIVGVGCEGVQVNKVYDRCKSIHKPVETVVLMDEGGYENALITGIKKAQKLVDKINRYQRTWYPLSNLSVGIKCGASDTTSGIISNYLVGCTVDLLIDKGASVVFGEVTEFIGAERYLANRCQTKQIRRNLLKSVKDIEKRIKDSGEDIMGGQPSEGNIKGGITTLEEKSLGAIRKSGTRIINNFLEYGDKISIRGLSAMEFPGREPEALTGMVAAGVQVIIFTTGLGAPQGFPFVPIIKVTGNEKTAIKLESHIDFYQEPLKNNMCEQASHKLLKKVLNIANGEESKSEMLKFYEPTNIWVKGPVI